LPAFDVSSRLRSEKRAGHLHSDVPHRHWPLTLNFLRVLCEFALLLTDKAQAEANTILVFKFFVTAQFASAENRAVETVRTTIACIESSIANVKNYELAVSSRSSTSSSSSIGVLSSLC
jgi:hypothetical protein